MLGHSHVRTVYLDQLEVTSSRPVACSATVSFRTLLARRRTTSAFSFGSGVDSVGTEEGEVLHGDRG
jgi:hypothetical protein